MNGKIEQMKIQSLIRNLDVASCWNGSITKVQKKQPDEANRNQESETGKYVQFTKVQTLRLKIELEIENQSCKLKKYQFKKVQKGNKLSD